VTVLRVALAATFSALTAAFLVEWVRRWAEARALLDHPTHRSSHQRPTPRGGGLAIVVTTIAGVVIAQSGFRVTSWRDCVAFLLPSLGIAIISWIDDVRQVPPLSRLAVHLGMAAAGVALFGGMSRISLPLMGTMSLGIAGSVLAVFWIAGLTNAYNFMDGVDGIAGLQGVVAGTGWAILAFRHALPLLSVSAALIAGACLGFLVHNWSPARIFMGDVGSAFLGFTFGLITVIATTRDPAMLFKGVLLVWPFVYDSTYTLLRRAMRGERLHEAHRTHLYQRLNQTGVSHAALALLYGAMSLAGLVAALIPPVSAAVPVIAVILTLGVHWRERSARSRLEHRHT